MIAFYSQAHPAAKFWAISRTHSLVQTGQTGSTFRSHVCIKLPIYPVQFPVMELVPRHKVSAPSPGRRVTLETGFNQLVNTSKQKDVASYRHNITDVIPSYSSWAITLRMALVLISQILTHPFVFHGEVIHETRYRSTRWCFHPTWNVFIRIKSFSKGWRKIEKDWKLGRGITHFESVFNSEDLSSAGSLAHAARSSSSMFPPSMAVQAWTNPSGEFWTKDPGKDVISRVPVPPCSTHYAGSLVNHGSAFA